jgi:hypothetical protein
LSIDPGRIEKQRTRFRNVGVGLANTGVNESIRDDSTNDPE